MAISKLCKFNFPLAPQDSKIYENAIRTIRKNLGMGLSYKAACESLKGIDEGLKSFIAEDFLKILIAEDHLGTGIGIDDMALFLGLPYEKIQDSLSDMMEEAALELSTQCPESFSPYIH